MRAAVQTFGVLATTEEASAKWGKRRRGREDGSRIGSPELDYSGAVIVSDPPG
jgi:hypothetical protein